ncbi:MAG: NUDIX domain-containing protein [Cyclobacteriaceae bacterium]|nr:NUDIX domain-containing protein [Cyclobacteriaceae bacterium]
MEKTVEKLYGNKVRVRVCGLLKHQDSLLLAKLHWGNNTLWAPPGGGVEFGEDTITALKREFREETGLEVMPGRLQFVCEYLKPPLHAIELFFNIDKYYGTIVTGKDPEMEANSQLIKNVEFVTFEQLRVMKGVRHGIFDFVDQPAEIMGLNGYFKL